MARIDLEQLADLAALSETLPAIKQEIAEIEKSIGKLNALLGKKASGKSSGEPKGESSPKPSAKKAAKKTAAKKKPQKPRPGLKEKVLAAIGSKTLAAAELIAVDGRANVAFLTNMVNEGILKQDGVKYSKA